MAFPALLFNPITGELLTYGALATGATLASLGIINNKDAIANGLRDTGNFVRQGISNGIGYLSDAVSPRFQESEIEEVPRGQFMSSDVTSYPARSMPPVLFAKKASGKKKTAAGASTGTAAGTATGATTGTAAGAATGTAADATTTTATTGTTTAGALPPKNDNDTTKNKKPSLIKRTVGLVKKYPKTTVGITLGATNLGRKYVVGPVLNYTAPAIGNAAGEIFAGATPFNIPIVANDSTDLWYNGKVGFVKDHSFTRQGYPVNFKETDASIEQGNAPLNVVSNEPKVPVDTAVIEENVPIKFVFTQP